MFLKLQHIIIVNSDFWFLQAMLVHPDKNMGNDKAADAFKKLQNAYEVRAYSLTR